MSLVTLERSSPSPHESENEDLLSTSSYEGFVARDHYAMCLSPRPFTTLGPGRSGDQLKIFSHLKKLVKIIRPDDMLRMTVELENPSFRRVTKYFVIITTNGHMGTEETILLGTEQEESTVRICLVLPIWRNTEIKLDGDGGFSVHTIDRHQVFKPSSVQSMWATLQMLYKSTKDAQTYNYYSGGLSHTWMSYYSSHLCSDGPILNEWNLTADVQSCRHDIYGHDTSTDTREEFILKKRMIRRLREVMLNQDLEEVTCRQLKNLVEMDVQINLKEYSAFLDQQIFRILGQMERPSQIFDYLYLGSEWNASNLPELKELGVKYILNISREIDNFYPEEFKYLNIKLYDLPTSQLMKHWDKTYTFIKEARSCGKKALVHCRMGISRSAATVTAYAMKEYKMSLNDALAHVKSKRAIVNPNEGFMQQLQAYEGILRARHNELWGKQAPPRPLPLHRSRSRSEPNLPDLANRSSGEGEPELSFLEEGETLNSPHLLPTSSSHLDRDLADQTTATSSSQICPPSLPIDKSQTILNFLASLPNIAVEDDQGLGENMMCDSESGSGYSSPVSTPTDDNHLHGHYSKLAKEVRKESKSASRKKEKEEGGGGSEGRLEDTSVQKEDIISPEDEGAAMEHIKPVSSEKSLPQHDSISAPSLPSPQVSADSDASLPSPQVSADSDIGVTMTTERHQPLAEIPAFRGIPKPLKSTSLPSELLFQYQSSEMIVVPPPNNLHSQGTFLPQLPPEQISSTPLHSSQGTAPLSLLPEKRSSSSLHSSQGTVTQQIPSSSSQDAGSLKVVESDSGEINSFVEVTENRNQLKEDHKSSEPSESKSDGGNELSATTATTEKLDLPQSQDLDISGPIEVPQIYSVPERIKEIEEMNLRKYQSKSSSPSDPLLLEKEKPETPPSSPHTTPSEDPLLLEKEKPETPSSSPHTTPSEDPLLLEKEKPETPSSSPHTTPSEGQIKLNEDDALIITRTSSSGGGHSASSSGDEEEELKHLGSNTSSPRHSSLGPDPPLVVETDGVDPQQVAGGLRFSSSPSELPPPPLPGSDLSPLSSAAADEIVHLEPGAVKARVLDIEERNRDERSVSTDELSFARRLSPPIPVRPASSSNVPETSTEVKILRQHLTKHRRPSSDTTALESTSHSVVVPCPQRRESTPPAFLSAWSKLIDSDVPSLPVQDLKKKFEDSDSVSTCSSNLGGAVNATTHFKTRMGGGGGGGGESRVYSRLKRSQSLRGSEFPGIKTARYHHTRGRSSGNKVSVNFADGKARARTDSPCSQD